MQFQVPQFIETEDKIVGPLSLKQFIYLAAAGLIVFLLFFVLELWLWFLIATILTAIAFALAFIKYNGRPISSFFIHIFRYLWYPRLYLWQRSEEAIKIPKIKLEMPPTRISVSPAEAKIERPTLRSLWLRLMTSTESLTKKIRPRIEARPSKEKFEIFRKITGEKEIASRVDYR